MAVARVNTYKKIHNSDDPLKKTMCNLFIEHLEKTLAKPGYNDNKVEVEGDGDGCLVTLRIHNGDWYTFVFDGNGDLHDIWNCWHERLRALKESDEFTEAENNKKIADAVKLIGSVFSGKDL